MSEDKKEEIQEKSLERRLERRQERRKYRIETVIPEDKFTKTSDFVSAILTGEVIAERLGAPPAVSAEEPRLFGDKFGLLGRRVDRETRVAAVGGGQERARTSIVDETNYTVNEYFKIIDSFSRGQCSEIAIRSPSQNFSLTVIIDGTKQFDRTYGQFVTISPQVDLFDAYIPFDDTSLYALEVGELNWRQSCEAILRVTESIIFSNIFVNTKEFLI